MNDQYSEHHTRKVKDIFCRCIGGVARFDPGGLKGPRRGL